MTDFLLDNEGDDFATIVAIPGQDDSFEVSGYATRGQVRIELPVYAHEARELIELLTPLAEKSTDAEASDPGLEADLKLIRKYGNEDG